MDMVPTPLFIFLFFCSFAGDWAVFKLSRTVASIDIMFVTYARRLGFILKGGFWFEKFVV